MRRALWRLTSAAGLFSMTACADSGEPSNPPADFAKAGGPATTTTYPLAVTLGAAGGDLLSDGKGAYQSEVCGVNGWASFDGTNWSFIMSPTGSAIPRSEVAACTGIAPRAATMTLATKHLSDNPHLDETGSIGSGTYNLGNIKLPPLGGTVINAGPACFHITKSGRISGLGLRLDADNYPGSNDLIREDLGGGQWHAYTAPWPNNVAFCEDDTGTSYWHVNVDITISVLP